MKKPVLKQYYSVGNRVRYPYIKPV